MTLRRPLTVAAAIAGVALFAYAVRAAGVDQILDGVRRVGWGLALILLLAGLRFAIRAECWRQCMTPSARIGFGRAWRAFLAGDAVGSITPLGLLASEPTKVFLTRHALAPRESVGSLALENLIYALSVLTMVALGVVVTLGIAPLPASWRWGAVAGLVAAAAGAALTTRLLRGTWDDARGERPRWRAKLSHLRLMLLGTTVEQRRGLWRVFALDLGFHALAVLEVYITLGWLMEQRPTLAQAIVFEALNRVITVVFKFVPFRVGVDEALSGALAPVLAVNPAAGVALAVVRKIRNLVWAAVGLALTPRIPAAATAPAPGAPKSGPPGSASARRL